MSTGTDHSIRTRESLLSRLRDLGDDTSWRDFFETYWRLVYNIARKSGFNDASAQDIVQETFAAAARHLPDFHYDRSRGSFKSWLLQITRSRIIDALRRRHSRQGDEYIPREEALSTSLLEAQSTEAALDAIANEEWRTHSLEVAIARVRQHADARQFQLFDLHVVKNVPALEVARRLGAKLPEVYFAKYKISARLKKELKRLENNPS